MRIMKAKWHVAGSNNTTAFVIRQPLCLVQSLSVEEVDQVQHLFSMNSDSSFKK